ncbi:S8 family serine peptidase [Variovorax sp. J22R115]|uniref:S8 family serine peptidase n=1 Tax=Variovorax sp. J22R115 TaxID=3053509 RepID=UPI002577AAB0|nr:S8 family serine peptidase [Variovorax sp. J22R115]MDM0048192.1 S8 family serine peptidase [Variovorax sp. J22R115]
MITHEVDSPDQPRPPRTAQPYLNWALRSERAFLRSGKWLPLLVEFAQGWTVSLFRRAFVDEVDKDDSIRVPRLFGGGALPDEFKFCVILVREDAAALTRSARWNASILRAELGPPVTLDDVEELVDRSVSESEAAWSAERSRVQCADPSMNPSDRRVVVAVLDEGIAFAHPRFARRWRPTSGPAQVFTRVEYVWVQDASGRIEPGTPGKEFTAARIDIAVHDAKAAGDAEDSVYRDPYLSVLDMEVEGYKPLARRQSHGTHVLDMASGYDLDEAPTAKPIIAVEMPEISVGDPAGSTLTVHAAWGLVYVLWRARSLRQPGETLPVVANLSYGPHEGPHDGSSAFECFVDALTEFSRIISTPMRVVLAAGNYRQSRTHARFKVQAGTACDLAWRIQPCGLTPSFMEIYFPSSCAPVSVTLISPDGTDFSISTDKVTSNVPVEPPSTATSPPPPPYTMEYVNFGAALSSIVISLSPTAEDYWGSGSPLVPSGIWTVRVELGSGEACFDAWIKRSDTPGGRRAKGRQSYFDDCRYLRFAPNGMPVEFDAGESYVQRQNTLSGIATGRLTYVIGAYRRGPDRADLMPTLYSSEASVNLVPTRTTFGVNWSAPGDDAFSCPGTLGAGTRSGMRVSMNGTSVAAPQAVRYLADVWAQTGSDPGPIPPSSILDPVSSRVPPLDRSPVAGVGLMRLKPPSGHVWERP